MAEKKSEKNIANKKLTTKIDLSKIKVKELPGKVVDIDLYGNGEIESFSIHALNDADRMCINMLRGNGEDVKFPRRLFQLLLTGGLDALEGDQSIADYLLLHCTDAAQTIALEIFNLTNEFYAAKDAEAEVAEKNSPSAAGSSEASEATQA